MSVDNWRIKGGCNGRLVIRVVGSIRSSGTVRFRLDVCLLGCILGRVLARMGDVGTFFLLHSDYGGGDGVIVDGYRPPSGVIAV